MLSRIVFLLTCFGLAGGIAYFWMSPWSPAIPHRARQKVLQGDVTGAINLLTWHADNALSDEVRHESLWYSAQLASLKLKDEQKAIGLLRRCLTEETFPYAVEANAELASLLIDSQPVIAIQHWQNAISLQPDHEKVGEWWLRIATAYERLASPISEEERESLTAEKKEEYEQLAIIAWNEVIHDKTRENMAHLALGRLNLYRDPASAKKHFQEASATGTLERKRSAEIGEQLAKWEIERQKTNVKGLEKSNKDK